jgi:hypothetical protein
MHGAKVNIQHISSPGSGIVKVCNLSVCYQLFLPNSSFPVTLEGTESMLRCRLISACRIVRGAMLHRQLLRQTNTAGCRFRRRARNERVGRCYYRLNHTTRVKATSGFADVCHVTNHTSFHQGTLIPDNHFFEVCNVAV